MRQSEAEPSFHKYVLWSGEANFCNVGFFKLVPKSSNLVVEKRKQHLIEFNVWCKILNNRIIGPILYHRNLTVQRYLDFLANEIEDALDELLLIDCNDVVSARWRIVQTYVSQRLDISMVEL